MSDGEKLDLLLGEMQGMKSEMQGTKSETQGMKSIMQELNRRMTNLELTLENETNHNIQLLAENHLNLIDKLNDAIKVSDRNLVYEVKMTSIFSRLSRLESDVSKIKEIIA